jgi:hypothetical protein
VTPWPRGGHSDAPALPPVDLPYRLPQWASSTSTPNDAEATRLIGWSGKVLAEHPDQRAELVEDRSLIPNTIEELLRYESPSPVQARYVSAGVEHYGHTIPGGSIMLVLTASANRDERRFTDPGRFDIHRKVGHHVAFGYGIHFCLGAALARLEGRVALDEVLQRFPTLGGRLGQRRAGPHIDRAGLGEAAGPGLVRRRHSPLGTSRCSCG